MPFIVFTLSLLLSNLTGQEPEHDLPDRDSFLHNVRANLRGDRLLQSQYTYNLKQTETRFDKNGNPVKIEINEYEIFPSLDEEFTYRRHVSKNGNPLSPEEIAKQDREHNKKLREREKKLAREGIDERTHRSRRQDEEKRKEDKIIDEIFQLYDISMIRREVIDGHSAILLSFQPNPRYKPATSETKMLKKLSGYAWFCEEDHQLMRVEVELIDNLSFGLGILARLNKGAQIKFLRRRVNNEVWLPAEARFSGKGRLLIVKGLNLEVTSEFSDYRKYSVETSIEYSRDLPP